MTRLRLTLPLCAFIAALATNGQTVHSNAFARMLDDASGLQSAERWEDAVKVYRRLEIMDSASIEVAYGMGVCLGHIPGEREAAAERFARAVRLGSVEAKYQLALTRNRQQRFDEAVALFDAYRKELKRDVPDEEIGRQARMTTTARQLLAHPVPVTITNMGPRINSKANDYSPVITADGTTMYFTSRRTGSTGGMRDPSGQYLEDIYVARRENGAWGNAANVGAPLNTFVHDATVGLSPDGGSMIIYRTAQNLVSGDLYECVKHLGAWEPPAKMTERVNSANHEPSATISPDGSEIYFTSDRPGGMGGRDIYRIRKLPGGEWSLPLNLGPAINTPYDEDAPFMHSDGTTLFFSSHGHSTMGGYDIFKSTLVDPDMNGWTPPENMGHPLNTVNDDIFFCLSEDGRTGYFSSERAGGIGGQDIYGIVFPESQLDHLVVRGVVTDVLEEPVQARIVLTGEADGEMIGVYNSNARTGRYLMVVKPGERYNMTVEAPGFIPRSDALSTVGVQGGLREIPLDLTLTRDENTAKAKP